MLNEVLQIFSGLAGLGALISMLVNVGKAVGWVKDGMGEKVFKVLNLVGFIAVAIVYIFVGDFDWGGLDSIFQLLATVLAFVVQNLMGKVAYFAIRGTPVLGYSHEDKKL
jgi:hypothetical protein